MPRITPLLPAALTAVALTAFPALAQMNEAGLGATEFDANCAVCHGADGKGGGPYAELLQTALPDLTTLSQRNEGVFPYERVRQIIDGRADVTAHGPRDMPIWGVEYSKEAMDYYQDFYTRAQAEVFVRGRILALIDHLQSIQEP